MTHISQYLQHRFSQHLQHHFLQLLLQMIAVDFGFQNSSETNLLHTLWSGLLKMFLIMHPITSILLTLHGKLLSNLWQLDTLVQELLHTLAVKRI